MKRADFLKGLAALSAVSACGRSPRPYNGPEVTRILVYKADRKMFLMHHDRVLRDYRIDLGFAPEGDKQVEGDGKTPEGDYLIDRKNPNSEFFLSVGISYPNEIDVAEAEALGQPPGGDIFIHGRRERERYPGEDWTWGCISVNNREIAQIYAMVNTGTLISIYA